MNLISGKKFGRYLQYFLGEIFIVVIGILVALAINNWNEERKDESKTLKYLNTLTENLNDDIASYDANLTINKTRLRGIFYLLEHAELNTGRFVEMEWIDVSQNDLNNPVWEGEFPDTLDRAFTTIAFTWLGRGFGGISLNKSVINELYATGYFSNIPNTHLKNKMGSYYSFLALRLEGYAIQEHEEWANETTRFFRDEYGIFTLDVTPLEDPISPIRGKKDVEDHLRYLALEVNYHCIWTTRAREKALELKGLVAKEIEKLRT